MKVSKAKAAENRELILDAAARLFREQGLAEVGVDALSAAAGLSHGSVYSQFGSKENLMREAMQHGFDRNAKRAEARPTLAETLDYYLSPTHRDRLGNGCVIAALGCEMPRQSRAVRHTFTEGVKRNIARLVARLGTRGKRAREDDAIALFAAMVGTLVLARGVDDAQLSDRILAASHKRLRDDFKDAA